MMSLCIRLLATLTEKWHQSSLSSPHLFSCVHGAAICMPPARKYSLACDMTSNPSFVPGSTIRSILSAIFQSLSNTISLPCNFISLIIYDDITRSACRSALSLRISSSYHCAFTVISDCIAANISIPHFLIQFSRSIRLKCPRANISAAANDAAPVPAPTSITVSILISLYIRDFSNALLTAAYVAGILTAAYTRACNSSEISLWDVLLDE